MTVPFRFAYVVVLLSLSGGAMANEERPLLASLEAEAVSLIEEVEPSIVSIVRGRFERPMGDRANPFGPGMAPNLPWNRAVLPDDASFVPDQFGAGVIVASESGEPFILTNQHVVHGGRAANDDAEESQTTPRVYVRLHDGRGFYARIRAADPRSDLAVLVPEVANGETIRLPTGLPISEAATHQKGELIFVFGNPYGVARDGSASVGWGMIGNVLRRPAPFDFPMDPESRNEETIHHHGTLLQLDCRTDLGFSGGATVNRKGELIGLTTSLAALEGYESTAGFAIPVDAGMQRILQSLLQGHEPEYGFLGVGPADISAAEMQLLVPDWDPQRDAVRVEFVKPGSAGDQGGLQGGDIILLVDGKPVQSASGLFREVGMAGPGAVVPFVVLRPRIGSEALDRISLNIRLDKWPVVNDSDLVATIPRHEPWRGLRVDYATARARYLSAQLEPYPKGVVVLAASETLGMDDPIEAGDFIVSVNDAPVDSPEEFYSLVRNAEMVTLRLGDGRDISVP